MLLYKDFHNLYFLSHIIRLIRRSRMILAGHITRMGGRAVAQAVSRRLPTAAARVRSQFRSCGICGKRSGTGAIFLRVLRFPLPILIPPTTPHSSSIIRGWYNRPTVADVPNGLSLTPLREIKKKTQGREVRR
jgi:hypothetical protein